MTQMNQMDMSDEELEIRKDFCGCCRQIAWAGWIVTFLIPALFALGVFLIDAPLFKRKLTVQEMADATRLSFPEEAERRRFKWIVYFQEDGWMAEIRFPAKRAKEISDSLSGMLETTSVSRAEPPPFDHQRTSFSADASQENYMGCFPSPSQSRFWVNAWMATNGTFGTIVLGYEFW